MEVARKAISSLRREREREGTDASLAYFHSEWQFERRPFLLYVDRTTGDQAGERREAHAVENLIGRG